MEDIKNIRVAALVLNWKAVHETINCLKDLALKISSKDRVFVLDNESTNASYEIINENILKINQESDVPLSVSVYKSSANLGFSGGINFLYTQLKKENWNISYIFLLNNDATLENLSTLDTLIEISKAYKDALCIPDLYNSPKSPLPYFKPQSWPYFLYGFTFSLKNKNAITPLKNELLHKSIMQFSGDPKYRVSSSLYLEGSALLIPEKVISNIQSEKKSSSDKISHKIFNDDFFLYYEDVELCLRAWKKNTPCLICHDLRAYHKISVSGGGKGNRYAYYYITRNRFFLAIEWLSFLEKMVFIPYYFLSRFILMLLRIMLRLIKKENFKNVFTINNAVLLGLKDALLNKKGIWEKH